MREEYIIISLLDNKMVIGDIPCPSMGFIPNTDVEYRYINGNASVSQSSPLRVDDDGRRRGEEGTMIDCLYLISDCVNLPI